MTNGENAKGRINMSVIFQDDIPELIWYAVAEIGALEDHIRSIAHTQHALLRTQEGKLQIFPKKSNTLK